MQRALLFAVFGTALAYELSPCQSGTRFSMMEGGVECLPCSDGCPPSFACPPNSFVWVVGTNNEVWCEPCSDQYPTACPPNTAISYSPTLSDWNLCRWNECGWISKLYRMYPRPSFLWRNNLPNRNIYLYSLPRTNPRTIL